MVGLVLNLMNDYLGGNFAVFSQTVGNAAILFMGFVYNSLHQFLWHISFNMIHKMNRCEITGGFIITGGIHINPYPSEISLFKPYDNIYNRTSANHL